MTHISELSRAGSAGSLLRPLLPGQVAIEYRRDGDQCRRPIVSRHREDCMSTIHRWFPSGAYSLLGHIDVPETSHGTAGVLIVPPFGWEDVCSYRPLRFLARTLAESGIPVMRFDLPGTGDSSGSALDSGLFEAWIQSVDDAAAELRAATGVKDVAVVGIRLGALLALSRSGARGQSARPDSLGGDGERPCHAP